MTLHRLTAITIGVPDPERCGQFYDEFGLEHVRPGTYATVDGGEQLHLTNTPTRRLVHYGIGTDDADDLERVAANLGSNGFAASLCDGVLHATEPATGVDVSVTVSAPIQPAPYPTPPINTPDNTGRPTARAAQVLRDGPVRPRRLGHCVLATNDYDTTYRFFVNGIGMKISDEVTDVGVFLRCSTDHHNLLIQRGPTSFLHHTSWQVDDVDDIGRGAKRLLDRDPARHVWGLGRHHIGANYFWYFIDPAGNFAEYYSDGDVIVDDELWTPQVFSGDLGLYNWGPPPPASFINPDDLAELMA